jgi:PAS domain S-box-containing protein
MSAEPSHPDEAARLRALRRYSVLDPLTAQALDDLTELAAHICDVPISVISFVDEHRQWFKRRSGMPSIDTPRELSFCGHVITGREVMEVADAARDPRFAGAPLVTGDSKIRFYAAAPLLTADGHALGALCVMDRAPRRLMPAQRDALSRLSRQVMAQLELRRRTEELAASEARLFEVFRNCPVGVAIHRWSDRTFVEVNTAFTNLFGWTGGEVVGRTSQELDMVGVEAAAALRARLQQDSVLRDAEVQLRTRDGGVRHVLMGTVLVELHDSPHTITTFVDITDRKSAEEALRNSDNRYRALFEYAPDGIVIADRTSHLVDVNPAMCRMLAYSRDELIGIHASAVVPPEEVAKIGSTLRIITSSSPYRREWQLRRKDGSTFVADVLAALMPDGNLMAMIRDVTERNHALEALRAAEERIRFVLQNAQVGIWDMDYATGVMRWSETLEAHYGLEPGSFGGTMEASIAQIHPDDRESVLTIFQAAMKAGSDFTMEYRAIRPDGTVVWLNGAGRVLLADHGGPLRAVGIVQDVTGRRILEAQYQQAQKMEAVGRLAGGVAHDFNNLLTVILGYCDLVSADLEAGDRRGEDVAEIHKAGQRAAGLTRQLLAFSRQQIIAPTLLDLNRIVEDFRAMLERLIGEHVSVVLALAPALGLVTADRGQVEQIVMNLAVNARDAMPKGGTLTIETGNVELTAQHAGTRLAVTPGRYVALTVRDTGTGMTPEVQARLFEPFFTTKEPGRGTGLGLATVYGIVTQGGGNVAVHSEVPNGTAVTVYFPQAEAVEMVPDTPVAGIQPKAGTQTILVVDDEKGLRELAKRLLERQGYTVLIAGDAAEAFRLADDHPSIDLLLTDVVMPGLSGPEMTRQLLAGRPTLKVIYMSGYTDDAILEHEVLKPGIAFLNKPFTGQTLGNKIREVLER